MRFELPPGAEPVKDEEVQAITAHFDVPPAMARLLTVMAREDAHTLTNRMKCALADISEDWYYATIKDERFIKAQACIAQGIISAGVIPASHALVRQAVSGDVTCIKTILEANAIYKPATVKHEVEHRLNDELLAMYRQQRAIKESEVIDME